MKSNIYFIMLPLLLTLNGCQKDEIEDDPQPYHPPVITEFAYFSGVLRDETSHEPISGVGIGFNTSNATYCGQTSDTTDQNGKFLLRTCSQINGSPSYIPYPDNIFIVVYDIQPNAANYQDVEYINVGSIQTGDTVFFDVYTTLDF